MASLSKIPYARRLYFWLLGYSLLLVACFIAYQYTREKDFKVAELNGRLQMVNNYIANELRRGIAPQRIDLADVQPYDDIRISIVDRDGTVVYDTSVDRLPDSNHLDREEIADAVESGTGYALRRDSRTTGVTYFYSATRMGDGSVIRTAVPYSVTLTSALVADYTFAWIMGGITLIFCVLGYFATRRLGQSVSRLNKFAAAAERGDRIVDTEAFPHDELGDISNHIVRLYSRLQSAVTERDREHAAAMHQQREKERIKKQLTNNINHELKTPVASIRVCAETLFDHPEMDDAKRRDFLQRLLANSDRLHSLLNDVSMITRMDDGRESVRFEPIDLTAIIAQAVEEYRAPAAAKGIAIEAADAAPLIVNGNASLLMSVFNNLINNAITYSGGTTVTIAVRSLQPQRVVLAVEDNGRGVPDEHLPHLFERFYRIDAGRSRAAGGTGLGLSIVKNAVLLHNGTIAVANRRTGGLTFTITLPLPKQ